MDRKVEAVLAQLQKKAYRAILTGVSQQSARTKRSTEDDVTSSTNVTGTYINGSTCALFSHSFTIFYHYPISPTKKSWMPIVIDPSKAKSHNSQAICSNITLPPCTNSVCGTASFTLSFTGSFMGMFPDIPDSKRTIKQVTLEFDIALMTSGYWYFTNVNLTSIQVMVGSQQTQQQIGPQFWTPTPADQGYQMYSVPNFAWACTESPPIMMTNGLQGPAAKKATWALQLNKFQVQPFLAINGKFTDNVDDCTGFFTIGIWMGIIIGLMMLLILFYAVSMITNLKTMDRFDDPKGKPIQINAKE